MSEPVSVDIGRGKKLRLTDEAFNVAAIIPFHEGNDDGSTFNPSQSVDDIFYGIDLDFENFPVTHSDFLDPANTQLKRKSPEVTTGTPALNPVTSIASEENQSKRGLPPTETPKAKRLRPTPSADTPLRRSNRILLDESTPLSSSSSKTGALSSAPAAVDTPKARQPPSRLRSSTSKTGALSSAPIASKDNQLKRGSPPVDTPRAKRLKQTSHVDPPLRRSERIKKRDGTTESSGSELVTGNCIESPESHPKANVPRNKVFTFGTGDCGELGQGPTAKRITRPRLVKFFEVNGLHIIEADAGGMHMLALDSEGRVWSWGVNDKGTLGRRINEGNRKKTLTPHSTYRILSEKAKAVFAGGRHSFVMTEDDTVLACDLNNYGQCGLEVKKKAIVRKPTVVPGLSRLGISMITTEEHYSTAMTSESGLIIWG